MQVEAVTWALDHGVATNGLYLEARLLGAVASQPLTWGVTVSAYLDYTSPPYIPGNGFLGYCDASPLANHFYEYLQQQIWSTQVAHIILVDHIWPTLGFGNGPRGPRVMVRDSLRVPR